ncbi:MAG: CDP-diacylglycerol--glycerol-3-phosphate 3-phosphatidyltransferase [Candidatus Omnitrophota bacterium]|nr:MAG: CDP-diacylglycerol--glycerol-3-phosphate 3-phosphatidyltransferase [Candidatus Omnitrophota bacterium]
MNFANKISTFRILCVPFFIASLIYYNPQREYLRLVALSIFILAVVSDAVDGYIARKAKQKSEAGLILDPLGDKLLLVSAFILIYLKFPGGVRFPMWVILVVITRDVLILLGAVVIFMVKKDINIVPTLWGKLTTIFQMLTITVVLLYWKYAFIFWWLAIFFTLVSGVDYIMRGFKMLYANNNSSNRN